MPSENVSISLINHADAINRLLRQFPTVIGILDPTSNAKHKVFDHIESRGPPVSQKARRLSGKKLKAAKREIEKLFKTGHARPYKNPWATSTWWKRAKLIVSWATIDV